MSGIETTSPDQMFEGVAHAEKYQSQNFIARALVSNFMKAIVQAVRDAGSRDVFEVGCGEGHVLGVLATGEFDLRGCDISDSSLAVASAEIAKRKLPIKIEKKSIYDLDPAIDSADTILCCEVLEHLTDPELGLRKLASCARKNLIVSVPNEPLWHVMNMARGKYWVALGNTPGHYNHWSTAGFKRFVATAAEVVDVKTPVPWTLLRCRIQ